MSDAQYYFRLFASPPVGRCSGCLPADRRNVEFVQFLAARGGQSGEGATVEAALERQDRQVGAEGPLQTKKGNKEEHSERAEVNGRVEANRFILKLPQTGHRQLLLLARGATFPALDSSCSWSTPPV